MMILPARKSIGAVPFDLASEKNGYSPGFSAPVIVRAVREARRQGGLPAPGNFLALCTRHRSWFQHAQARMHDLLEIRQNAEDILIKLGDDRVTDLGVPCDDDW
jgi:hypothetical protein